MLAQLLTTLMQYKCHQHLGHHELKPQLATAPHAHLQLGALVINFSVALFAAWKAVSERGVLAKVEFLCLQQGAYTIAAWLLAGRRRAGDFVPSVVGSQTASACLAQRAL